MAGKAVQHPSIHTTRTWLRPPGRERSAAPQTLTGMRTKPLLPLAPILFACAPHPNTERAGLLAEDHAPLRSACVALDVPLRQELRLGCPTPSWPESGDTELWPGALPVRGHWTRPDGVEGDLTFAPGMSQTFGEVTTHRADGGIESATFPHLFPSAGPVVHFDYDGDTLVGAHVAWPDGRVEAETEIVYADGRRAYEGLVGNPGSRFEYTYDAEGRVVARIGACAKGRVPALPEAAMLAEACPTFAVPQPLPEMAGHSECGLSYYFRNAEGRIVTALHGAAAGFAVARVDFTWDGDRLVGADRTCSATTEQAFRDVRLEYGY